MVGSQLTKIAYFVDSFPETSETFVFNEILALQSMGVAIEVFSLSQPAKMSLHPHAAALSARTHYYVPQMDCRVEKAIAHLGHAIRRPVRYVHAWRWANSIDEDLSWNFKRMGSFAHVLASLAVDHIH